MELVKIYFKISNKITIIISFHAFFCFYFSICLFWIRIRIQGGNGLRIHADLNPIFLILLRSHTFTVGSTSPIALFPIYYCFLICSEGEKVQFWGGKVQGGQGSQLGVPSHEEPRAPLRESGAQFREPGAQEREQRQKPRQREPREDRDAATRQQEVCGRHPVPKHLFGSRDPGTAERTDPGSTKTLNLKSLPAANVFLFQDVIGTGT